MIPFVIVISCLSLVFAVYLARQVLSKDTGTPKMRDISDAIKEGAEAFMSRQNRTIIILSAVLAALIFLLYAYVRTPSPADPVPPVQMAFWTTLSFVLGAACSVIAGYVGMWVSIRANIRTAAAVRSSLNEALQIAMRGGAVSGLFVVAMSLLGVGGLYALLDALGHDPQKIPFTIVGYGFGASFVALFAQLGGGIYTKAADVGADLVGKVEAGIPEDDPRNPGGHRRSGRRQRRRLRRSWRRFVRVHRSGEYRRDDSGRRLVSLLRFERDSFPAGRARLRSGRFDRRYHDRENRRRWRPDGGAQPRLLRHQRLAIVGFFFCRAMAARGRSGRSIPKPSRRGSIFSCAALSVS